MTRLPCEVTFSHRSALSEPISSTTCTHHSLLNFNLWHWIEGTQILPRSPVTRESGNSFYLAGLYSPGSSQGKRRPVHVPPSTESGGGGRKASETRVPVSLRAVVGGGGKGERWQNWRVQRARLGSPPWARASRLPCAPRIHGEKIP